MRQFTFDVMDGPAVEFSETRAFPDIAAARIYAEQLARGAHAMRRDVEGWRIELCDADDRIVDTLQVMDYCLPNRPSRLSAGGRIVSGQGRRAQDRKGQDRTDQDRARETQGRIA